MATLEQDENQSAYQIKAYKPGIIQINDKIFNHSLIVSATQLVENWAPVTVTDINSDMLDIIKNWRPDILLIGTGSELIFIKAEVYGQLINAGIGVEIMNTSAACRTFNALTAENRNVVAALII